MRIPGTTLTEIKKIAKYWLSILLLICFAGQESYTQEAIGGVINQYAKIERIFNAGEDEGDFTGIDSVIVKNASSIWDGSELFEIALFVQMKGVRIYDPINRPFIPGDWGEDNKFYNTGIYSLMLVDRVEDDSIVIFSSSLRDDMLFGDEIEVPSTMQLIKVPYYQSAWLNNDLSAQPWDSDSGTGGVAGGDSGTDAGDDAGVACGSGKPLSAA